MYLIFNSLHQKGIKDVIVTLGKRGCLWSNNGESSFFEAPKVKAIDTTGAGDTFNGALAADLSRGHSIEESIQFACRAAAKSVTRIGAQTGIPLLSELS